MLLIRRTLDGYKVNQPITERIFQPLGNTTVRVRCENPYYGDKSNLEDEVCAYISKLIENRIQVHTHHATNKLSLGHDSSNHTYIKEVEFQIIANII